MSDRSQDPIYVCGHQEAELRRLTLQAEADEARTHDLFTAAGIREGMRVIDLGSGAGDVAFLAAKIVGPTGSILGVERSPEAARLAEQRASAMGFTNVRFVVGDETAVPAEAPFDALVGRYVLKFQRDPSATVRTLAKRLRPGGVVVFQEMDLSTGGLTWPPAPLYVKCARFIEEVCLRGGNDVHMGMRLRKVLRDAGVIVTRCVATGRAEDGDDSHAYPLLAESVRSLMRVAGQLGIPPDPDLELSTLEDRLRQETRSLDATVMRMLMFTAWGTLPTA